MKVLMLISDNYDDSEVLYPYYRLLEEDVEVDVASFEKKVVPGKYHFKIQANKTFEEVKQEEYCALVIPGGSAPEKIRQNKVAINIVKYFMEKSLPVGAICHGQQILISAGVLAYKNVTCYPGIKDDIINAKARYFDKKVVIDGNLVTSRRPSDLPYFMRELIKLIKGMK